MGRPGGIAQRGVGQSLCWELGGSVGRAWSGVVDWGSGCRSELGRLVVASRPAMPCDGQSYGAGKGRGGKSFGAGGGRGGESYGGGRSRGVRASRAGVERGGTSCGAGGGRGGRASRKGLSGAASTGRSCRAGRPVDPSRSGPKRTGESSCVAWVWRVAVRGPVKRRCVVMASDVMHRAVVLLWSAVGRSVGLSGEGTSFRGGSPSVVVNGVAASFVAGSGRSAMVEAAGSGVSSWWGLERAEQSAWANA